MPAPLRWEDHTLASTWRRAPRSFSSESKGEEAPFGKVTLSKLLVLKDKDTREDYFAQQAAFVTLEGRKDVQAVCSWCISFPLLFRNERWNVVHPATNSRFLAPCRFRDIHHPTFSGVRYRHRGRRVPPEAPRRAARASHTRVQEDNPLRRPLPTARVRPLRPPRSIPTLSDMVREALRRDTRDGR